jgi:tartrate dehydratase beta subunit/fumarate hydratase class I family protein
MDPLIPKAVWGFNGTERPGAVYLAAVGGTAALLATRVTSAEPVAYGDLGTEALARMELVDFPVWVAIDTKGHDLYAEARDEWAAGEGRR